MQRLWSRTWIFVGHDSQIPEAGDYFAANIGRQPVMMVRQTDGSVRVMRNRCSHKGAKLVSDTQGSVVQPGGRFFRCPYHAWTYRLDGALRGVPLKGAYANTSFRGMRRRRGDWPNFPQSAIAASSSPGFLPKAPASRAISAARSPRSTTWPIARLTGELEVAGGVLRYMHDSNWKMFVENLNDTMHPMVAHESAAGTAKRLWADKPEPTRPSRWRSSS